MYYIFQDKYYICNVKNEQIKHKAMKTIKIINEQLYNECVIIADLENLTGSECDLELELTGKGLQILFPDNYKTRPSRFNITGEFGRFDYKDLGFEII